MEKFTHKIISISKTLKKINCIQRTDLERSFNTFKCLQLERWFSVLTVYESYTFRRNKSSKILFIFHHKLFLFFILFFCVMRNFKIYYLGNFQNHNTVLFFISFISTTVLLTVGTMFYIISLEHNLCYNWKFLPDSMVYSGAPDISMF